MEMEFNPDPTMQAIEVLFSFFFFFIYGLFLLEYSYITMAWQRNLAKTTVILESYMILI